MLYLLKEKITCLDRKLSAAIESCQNVNYTPDFFSSPLLKDVLLSQANIHDHKNEMVKSKPII